MNALEGIRVLDLGTFVAGPHCATILGEFGAEVIKVEPPGTGDSLRRLGTRTECGDTLVWLSESRNKKCITLDLKQQRGRDLLRALTAKCDVVVENFRPGTLEKWGLGYEALHRINPRAVLVRISAYGQEGPMRDQPGFARIAHAFSGLAYLAGEAGRVPVVPGSTSLADYMSGMCAAIGTLVALRARERTGEGQVIDLALFESIFRTLDEIVPAYERFGTVRERNGADTTYLCPHSHYQAKDRQWIAIACSNDTMFERLASAMGKKELSAPDRFATTAQRVAARDEVNGIVAAWVGGLTAAEVLTRCETAGVPAGAIYSIRDIFSDPQYWAREAIRKLPSRIGPLSVPAVFPKLSATPGDIKWLGVALGAHNDEVFGELLGLDEAERAELAKQGVI